MSGATHSQFKEVLEYDLSVFGLYATSAPVLRSLAAMSAHPVGRVALISQAGAFVSALGNLVKQSADIYMAYESDLNKMEQKLNDVRAEATAEAAKEEMLRGGLEVAGLPHVADLLGDARRAFDERASPRDQPKSPAARTPSARGLWTS